MPSTSTRLSERRCGWAGTAIADDNPFRFSTKYLDSDGARKRVDGDAGGVARRAEEAGAPWALMRQSGLIYYGFRYYSPSLGRFLNRDPLGELGGNNLYAFVENDPVNGWDYLGLDDELVCDPADSDAGLCNDDGQNIDDDEDIEELEEYEVIGKRRKPRKWRGPSGYPKAPIDRSIGIDTNFPVRNPGDSLGGGGGGDGGGPSGNDGCDEEKEEDDRPFWCAAIEGALAANRNIGAAVGAGWDRQQVHIRRFRGWSDRFAVHQ